MENSNTPAIWMAENYRYVTKEGEVSPEEPDLAEDIPLPLKPRAPKAYRKRGNSALAAAASFPDSDVLTIKDWCNLHFKYFSLCAGVAIKGNRPFRAKETNSLYIKICRVTVWNSCNNG